MKDPFYKEFKILGHIFAFTKIGVSLVTEDGNYGFKLYTDGLRISRGFHDKYFYWS